MSDIREKIMALEFTREPSDDNFDRSENAGYYLALKDAADIAEAEVARLEALLVDVSAKAANCGYELVQKEKDYATLVAAARRLVEEFKKSVQFSHQYVAALAEVEALLSSETPPDVDEDGGG